MIPEVNGDDRLLEDLDHARPVEVSRSAVSFAQSARQHEYAFGGVFPFSGRSAASA